MKNQGVKREKRIKRIIFFVKQHKRSQCFLQSYIYNDNKNIYMFIKKTLNKKKIFLRLFNNALICWTKLKTKNPVATGKQLIRKNSIC